MPEIGVMRESLDRYAACSLVCRLADGPAEIERRIYYPYFRFGISGLLRWLFGRRTLQTRCLVDARTGRASTADSLSLERRAAIEEDRLRRTRPAGWRAATRRTHSGAGCACSATCISTSTAASSCIDRSGSCARAAPASWSMPSPASCIRWLRLPGRHDMQPGGLSRPAAELG